MNTECTQEKVYLACAAFYKVHGRLPAIQHLVIMLHASHHVIRRFDRRLVATVPVKQEYVKLAKTITVLSEAEVNQKKARGGMRGKKRNKQVISVAVQRGVESAMRRSGTQVEINGKMWFAREYQQ